MSSPKFGTPPTIVQDSLTLRVSDRGDFWTQEGKRPDRTAVQWERQLGDGGWEVIGPHLPPMRTLWGTRPVAEDNLSLSIGAENVGRKFRVLVAAGVGPSPDGGRDWTEWGSAAGDDSGRLAYSNVLTVAKAGQPAPVPKPPDVAGAITLLDVAERELKASKGWKDTEARYDDPVKFAQTHIGKAMSAIWQAREGLR